MIKPKLIIIGIVASMFGSRAISSPSEEEVAQPNINLEKAKQAWPSGTQIASVTPPDTLVETDFRLKKGYNINGKVRLAQAKYQSHIARFQKVNIKRSRE